MTIHESTGPGHATTTLTIDLDALTANYQLLAARAAPAQCAAVVKADGYGLGLEPVAQTLAAAGCSTFFVAHLDEGVALRMILKDQEADIFVFNGLMPGAESAYRVYQLFPVLNDLGQIERWNTYCAQHGTLPAALHLDTGMSRLGLPPQELKTLIAEPDRLSGLDLRSIVSHLACADTPDHPLNRQQQSAFAAAIAQLPKATASLAASSGIFLGPDWHFEMVRPGVSLYGSAPVPGEANPMSPVVSLTGQILQIREVDAPQTVGYGASYQFSTPTRVATVAAGYADGYLRSISGKGTAYIGDTAVPVVGRVSMDLITLDVSGVPTAQPGDSVELIGPHHDIDALAAEAGTIGYEILTSLGGRYRRRYSGGDA